MCGISRRMNDGRSNKKIKGRLQRHLHRNFSAMLVAYQPTMKVKYFICSHSLVTQGNQNSYYQYLAYCNLLHKQFRSLTQVHRAVIWIQCSSEHMLITMLCSLRNMSMSNLSEIILMPGYPFSERTPNITATFHSQCVAYWDDSSLQRALCSAWHKWWNQGSEHWLLIHISLFCFSLLFPAIKVRGNQIGVTLCGCV